jgi:hypothetical protein
VLQLIRPLFERRGSKNSVFPNSILSVEVGLFFISGMPKGIGLKVFWASSTTGLAARAIVDVSPKRRVITSTGLI